MTSRFHVMGLCHAMHTNLKRPPPPNLFVRRFSSHRDYDATDASLLLYGYRDMDSMGSAERADSDEVCLFALAKLVNPLVSSSFHFSSSRVLSYSAENLIYILPSLFYIYSFASSYFHNEILEAVGPFGYGFYSREFGRASHFTRSFK